MGARAGARAAGRLYAGRLLRRRMLSIVALGLLGAIGLAIAASAAAGARRSETAYSRLSEATLAADAVVFASQVGIGDPDWSAVADLPYIEAAGAFGMPDAIFVDGPDWVPLGEGVGFSTSFGDWRTSVDRPVLIEGRYPDPSRPDEALASVTAADIGVKIGDRFVVRMNTPEQSEVGDWGDPKGPTATITVTGIGKSTFEAAVIGPFPMLFVTRAFDEQYGDGITFVSNLMVRFAEGEHDVARLEEDARRLLGASTLPVLDAEAVGKRVTNGTGLEANGLWLFAAAVAAATVVLVGQAVSRAVRSVSAEATTLRALGFARSGTAAVLALPFAVVAATAAAGGVAGAIALSARFPIGLAREIDPDPGLHADWTVLAAGVALTVAAFGAITWWTAWREAGGQPATAIARTSRIAASLARAGVPLPVSHGARLALESGRGAASLPTRPAVAGAVVGVLGVVGGFTLAAGIDDAVAHPVRVGSFWDLEASWFLPGTPRPPDVDAIHDDPDVVNSADVWRGLVLVDGVTQPTYAVDARRGTFEFVVMSGRAPTRPGEIALGPATAREYGVGIGETMTAASETGGAGAVVEVVGLALLPETAHSGYDQGAWVSPEQLAAIDADAADPGQAAVFADFADGIDVDAKVAAVVASVANADPLFVEPPTPPRDLQNLENVSSLPVLFAVFTTALALATLAHAGASVLRRRRNELAVLRSLGMTPGQTRAALSWQATTLAVVGVVIGVPAGVVAGRSVWRWVATNTPIVYVTPVALAVMLLVAPAALGVANLLALWPGRRAARLSPAAALRDE